ncbi:hypothetical protein AYI68_g1730 [Smittium mucronatum]|uniref:CASTOR ACT domain-containing protein n=1 Tax=Smittium mucronatum TaxID=133383 RepID=A0A1R0H4J7_9FUNG|nr:hypothetical protein AYI68_g1730 [Smittium mucronatum]
MSLSLSAIQGLMWVYRIPTGIKILEIISPFLDSDPTFYSFTKTADEQSLIVNDSHPGSPLLISIQQKLTELLGSDGSLKIEKDWKALVVNGVLDFGLVGILANISDTLAKAKIPIFVVSTYDTDYVLVKQDRFQEAVQALQDSGCAVIL